MDRIRSRWCLLAVLVLWMAGLNVAASQTLEDDLTEYLHQYYQSSAGQDEVLSQLNIPPDRRQIYREFLERIFNERSLLREVARNILSIRRGGYPDDFDQIAPIMAEVGFGVAQESLQQGLRRLASADIRLLLAHEAMLLEQVSPQQCMGLIENQLSADEATQITMDYQRTLSHEDLREYLNLGARALLAHFRDSPQPNTITPHQRQIAMEQFERALAQHPHFDLMARISVRPNAHSAAENCWMSTQSLWVAIEQEGIIGDWLMILFASDM